MGRAGSGRFPTGLDRISCPGPALRGSHAWRAPRDQPPGRSRREEERPHKEQHCCFLKGKGTRRSAAGTCLEAFDAIGANLPRAELTGMLHPCRKPPDTGKANKMKREGLCFPSRTQLPQRPSHITDLQTNYFEPDILKNFPLQLSEHRESQNRELGSRLR